MKHIRTVHSSEVGPRNVLGPAIRLLRQLPERKMSQNELADELNAIGVSISRSAIAKIENQTRHLSDVELLSILAVLECSAIQLLEASHSLTKGYSI